MTQITDEQAREALVEVSADEASEEAWGIIHDFARQELARKAAAKLESHRGVSVETVEAWAAWPAKLELLADWFDLKYHPDPNPEVQRDLRQLANDMRRAIEAAKKGHDHA